MRRTLLLLATMIFGFAPALVYAESPASTSTPVAPAFSDSQKAAIEDIIKDYLTRTNPDVVLQAMQELQRRDQASAQTKSEEAIKGAKDKIYNNPATPIGGNPKGDVTIVEFFDYQCGYCKMSEPEVEKLMKEDKNIRFIYKDFPILGPMSVEAAKASLASIKQNGYIKFHDELMSKKDHVSDDLIYDAAKQAGLDVEKLKKDMADDAIAQQVKDNLELGQTIGVRGTPMFIIGEQIYPGALQYDQLKQAVADARSGTKKN